MMLLMTLIESYVQGKHCGHNMAPGLCTTGMLIFQITNCSHMDYM